jgi:hypothetical protein
MLSKSSKKYFSFYNKFKYFLYKLNISERKYFHLILKGIIPRPHYAFGVFFSSSIASQLGYKKISLFEFGCWEGEGLLDLEHYSAEIEKLFNIEIEIYGFEGGTGMPPPVDYKDRVYQYSEGEMKTTKKSSLNSLKRSKLIYGNFKETVPDFIKNNKFAPIGALFNDADYFSSTKDSFKIFDHDNKLPKVFLYFDDLNFSSNFTGELGAINDFNQTNKSKIETVPELSETMSLYWKKWNFLAKRFYLLHNFEHPKYNERYINPFYNNLDRNYQK